MYQFSETVAASFGIKDEVVGIKSDALFHDGDSSTFRQHSHGNLVLPISAVVSGHLAQIIQSAENIPTFSLLVKNAGPVFKPYNDATAGVASVKIGAEDNESSKDDDSSCGTVNEYSMCMNAFIELMESSVAGLNPVEKNELLRFGIDNIDVNFGESRRLYSNGDGNVLFRAAFRIA